MIWNPKTRLASFIKEHPFREKIFQKVLADQRNLTEFVEEALGPVRQLEKGLVELAECRMGDLFPVLESILFREWAEMNGLQVGAYAVLGKSYTYSRSLIVRVLELKSPNWLDSTFDFRGLTKDGRLHGCRAYDVTEILSETEMSMYPDWKFEKKLSTKMDLGIAV